MNKRIFVFVLFMLFVNFNLFANSSTSLHISFIDYVKFDSVKLFINNSQVYVRPDGKAFYNCENGYYEILAFAKNTKAYKRTLYIKGHSKLYIDIRLEPIWDRQMYYPEVLYDEGEQEKDIEINVDEISEMLDKEDPIKKIRSDIKESKKVVMAKKIVHTNEKPFYKKKLFWGLLLGAGVLYSVLNENKDVDRVVIDSIQINK